MKEGFVQACVALVLLCAIATGSAFAQGGAGTTIITGTVTDSSGGVLPGASVVAKNTATTAELTATTNEQGQFTIPAVQPGTYTLTVTMPSFKTAVVNEVRVSPGAPAAVKVTMEVGGVNETVNVASGSEIIQTQSAAVTSTIDTNQILKLPTGSRSALEFVVSLPGVNTPSSDTRQSTINGLPQAAINITIDGVSAQDNHLKTGDGFFSRVSPRLDAMEEVSVSTAAQDAANTGQGAVQIRFVTRSGSNQYSGSGYLYMQHYKLSANSWFNNRDGIEKDEDELYQPGGRLGGPIIIPGLWDGRNKAFFFVNYEQSRSFGHSTENRLILHPLAEQGIFRYTAGGQTREVNLLAHAAANGLVSTIDPTIGKLFADIRAAVGNAAVDLPDPLQQEFRYQFQTKNITKYPTGRLDFNLTDKHRLSGSFNYTDLHSIPDTTNDRETRFPGFPGTGSQPSKRYATQVNLRSTLTQNLVNEFKVGGSGGATRFSPEITPAQYGGTPVADTAGFHLLLDSDSLDISNVHTGPTYQAREGTTRILENTLSYLKGNHNIQAGFAYTRAQAWVQNQTWVPTITFGIASNDTTAQQVFSSANIAALGGATPSTAQLNDARELYAVLTGRITQISSEMRLDETTDEYRLLGRSVQRARLEDYGFFIADSWRWKPNLTLNLGLRYELQRPFFPLNNSYSKATIDDVCGRSGASTAGSCNLFQQGVQPGKLPEFFQFNKGEKAYNTDRNNFAPNIGIAWTLPASGGFFGTIFGQAEGDSVLRGGYTLGYNRPGTSDFTGTIDDNVGLTQSATRNHSIGNLGTPGTILFRNRSDLGPPPGLPVTRNYPLTDIITEDIALFEPNIQVPSAQTWTAGWQRKLTADLAIEARYVGSRADQNWITYNYNEVNIVENGFLDEFRLAQQNLQANISAGRGANFRYFGPDTGTNPLPIIYAYFTGRGDNTNVAQYASSSLFTSATFLNPLAKFSPAPATFANALDAEADRRDNAIRAGLPANFLVANPDLLGGAEVNANGGGTRYHSAQFELRKRLSHGLQFNASYVFGRAKVLQSDSFRAPWRAVLDGGTEGGVTHAFKGSWTYELPFGQGRRFLSGAGPWLDRLINGWSFDGIARIQSGRLVSLQGVRLVGMTEDELQKVFKTRFDADGKLAYSLPQDIIDNTVKAFSVSATTESGYGDRGAPEGRYIAPGFGPNCISAVSNLNECTPDQLTFTGPRLVRFDLSAVKRVTIKGRVNGEFRAEFLNAFNHPWFTPVLSTSTNPNNHRVTGATGARTIQLVWRVNF